MKRISIIMATIICLCSCEKDNAQKHEWLSRTWYGEYETKNIVLEFSDDKSRCISDKRILKWREGDEERVITIEAMKIE